MIYEPQPGELRILLDLADDPRRDIQTTTETAQLGVVIPEALYQRLLDYQSLSPKEPEETKEQSA